ncbi:hypothetical protein OAQ84_00460 [Bdellovibrionales bacterium]|nr:hypothetical protein [Bdellovibrionales bacterium]
MKAVTHSLLVLITSTTLIAYGADSDGEDAGLNGAISVSEDGTCSPAFMSSLDEMRILTIDMLDKVFEEGTELDHIVDQLESKTAQLELALNKSGHRLCMGRSSETGDTLIININNVKNLGKEISELKKQQEESPLPPEKLVTPEIQAAIDSGVNNCPSEINHLNRQFKESTKSFFKILPKLLTAESNHYEMQRLQNKLQPLLAQTSTLCHAITDAMNSSQCLFTNNHKEKSLLIKESILKACVQFDNEISGGY